MTSRTAIERRDREKQNTEEREQQKNKVKVKGEERQTGLLQAAGCSAELRGLHGWTRDTAKNSFASLINCSCHSAHSLTPFTTCSSLSPRPPPLRIRLRRRDSRRRRRHCHPVSSQICQMFNSSPFRASHRRSRSHSSPSAPNSSPISRHDDFRAQPIRSPAFIKTKTCAATPFASIVQPPEKWDVEAWRSGKRARREPSSPSDDADMESCDEPMPSSPVAAPMLPNNASSTSEPSTPHLPSTSDAFQFFQSKASTVSNDTKPAVSMFSAHTPTVVGPDSHDAGLAQMHSDAFSDLRKTVVEAGEGFVRRMREFEAHRSRAGPSRGTTHAQLSDRKDLHRRGRKRPPVSTRHLMQPSAGIRATLSAQGLGDEDAEESDVEFRSSYVSGSDDYSSWSPSKKRAVSLDALYNKGVGTQSQSHASPFPIPLRSRDRSSSPSVYADSSEEDEDLVDRVRQRRPARFHPTTLSAKSSTPPLSFSFSSASNNSSRVSLPAGAPSPISHSATVKPSIGLPIPSPRSSKRAEMAVAALSLAIANGAGSVSDYEALRNAQGAITMDDSEAGGLWD